MNRRLFEDLVVSSSGRRGRAYPWPVSLGIHAAVVAGVVTVPLLGSAELPSLTAPSPTGVVVWAGPPPSLAAPPPAPVRVAAARPTRPPRSPHLHTAAGPSLPPRGVLPPLVEPGDFPPPEDAGGSLSVCFTGDCVPGGDPEARPGGDGETSGVGTETGPGSAPIRVGGDIELPRKLSGAPPAYPEVARHARVKSLVILECTIDPRGRVTGVKVLRGHPLFDEAAVKAVSAWVYTPTRLNGVPVAVIMTVTVRFDIS
jgi:periplasmic protein TonB